jgi:uncharacterized protein
MTIVIIVVVSCVLLLLAMFKEANENNVRKHVVKAIGKKETLRLFFISDTHARKINEKMIKNLDGQMDAVVIGGDFVDKRTSRQILEHNIRLLKRLGPVYFVWGNNDIEFGEQQLRRNFDKHQVRVLENEAVMLPSKNQVKISAVVYSPNEQKIAQAVSGCDENKTIFVAHNPQQFPKVYRQFKPLLSMGGHLHGGQIRFGSYGIQPHGSFKKMNTRYELVSNGYGTTLLPLRFCAKPECHIIELKFNEK